MIEIYVPLVISKCLNQYYVDLRRARLGYQVQALWMEKKRGWNERPTKAGQLGSLRRLIIDKAGRYFALIIWLTKKPN
jgi:hypothetical protein